MYQNYLSCWLAGLGVTGVLGSGVPQDPAELWSLGEEYGSMWGNVSLEMSCPGTIRSLSTLYCWNYFVLANQ